MKTTSRFFGGGFFYGVILRPEDSVEELFGPGTLVAKKVLELCVVDVADDTGDTDEEDRAEHRGNKEGYGAPEKDEKVDQIFVCTEDDEEEKAAGRDNPPDLHFVFSGFYGADPLNDPLRYISVPEIFDDGGFVFPGEFGTGKDCFKFPIFNNFPFHFLKYLSTASRTSSFARKTCDFMVFIGLPMISAICA